jgi:hypothetical protein
VDQPPRRDDGKSQSAQHNGTCLIEGFFSLLTGRLAAVVVRVYQLVEVGASTIVKFQGFTVHQRDGWCILMLLRQAYNLFMQLP